MYLCRTLQRMPNVFVMKRCWWICLYFIYISNQKLNCQIKHYKTFLSLRLDQMSQLRAKDERLKRNNHPNYNVADPPLWKTYSFKSVVLKYKQENVTNLKWTEFAKKRRDKQVWVQQNILYLRIQVDKRIQKSFIKRHLCTAAKNKSPKISRKSICTTDTRQTTALIKH